MWTARRLGLGRLVQHPVTNAPLLRALRETVLTVVEFYSARNESLQAKLWIPVFHLPIRSNAFASGTPSHTRVRTFTTPRVQCRATEEGIDRYN